MVNQICIAGLVQGLAEGIHFAKKAGLDIEAVIATISKGAAQSWQMENRYKTMSDGKYDFGFAVDWMRKDLVDLPRRGARATARTFRSPRWSISSTPRCRRWAAGAGTHRPCWRGSIAEPLPVFSPKFRGGVGKSRPTACSRTAIDLARAMH